MSLLESPPRGKGSIAASLTRVREGTLALLAPLADAALCTQWSPLQSPLVWDLAHIGHFEELWLVRALGRSAALDARTDDLYDAARHQRAERARLNVMQPDEARAYLREVRERTLAVLDGVELDGVEPLLDGGFVYGLVLQHELQHQETMLITLQLADLAYPLPDPTPAPRTRDHGGEAAFDGGPVIVGTDAARFAYDNERPAHEVQLAPFRLDRAPVSNGAFLEFVEAGGYADEALWSADGWKLAQGAELAHPGAWEAAGEGSWALRRFGHVLELPLDEPVQHVSFHEAEAFARFAGRRLPTEAEWEHAAAGTDNERANLGWQRLWPTPVGSYPGGASSGVLQLLGDVWEWTATPFDGYPGFRAFPYAEYSEAFFTGEYRVLRGGSFATDPLVARRTFRNWDYPIRRQLFAGFRTAADG